MWGFICPVVYIGVGILSSMAEATHNGSYEINSAIVFWWPIYLVKWLGRSLLEALRA